MNIAPNMAATVGNTPLIRLNHVTKPDSMPRFA
jgi:hypothetical protein